MMQGIIGVRGQAVVTDLLISIAVFILLVTITTVLWDVYNIRLSNRVEYDNMVVKSFQISDSLLKGRGIPRFWETLSDESEVQLIGLVDRERVLDYEKMQKFRFFNDTLVRDMFKLGQYNYFFRVTDLQEPPNELFQKGVPPSGKFTVNLVRYAQYDTDGDGSVQPQIVNVEFALWR